MLSCFGLGCDDRPSLGLARESPLTLGSGLANNRVYQMRPLIQSPDPNPRPRSSELPTQMTKPSPNSLSMTKRTPTANPALTPYQGQIR